ncbi:unnamed protein product, partial [Staurois parvus]
GGRRTPRRRDRSRTLRRSGGRRTPRRNDRSQAPRRGGGHRVTRHNRGLRVNWDDRWALGQTLDRLAGQRASGHQASGHFGSTAGTASSGKAAVGSESTGTTVSTGSSGMTAGHWVTSRHQVIWLDSGAPVHQVPDHLDQQRASSQL